MCLLQQPNANCLFKSNKTSNGLLGDLSHKKVKTITITEVLFVSNDEEQEAAEKEATHKENYK